MAAGKHSDVQEYNLSNSKVENNLMRHMILMKRKNLEKLQEIFESNSGSTKEKVMGVLMQISVYQQLNNQAKYMDMFQNLMEVNALFHV